MYEMDANTSLSELRAWSRRGQRAYFSVLRNRGPNTTSLSSMTIEGMGASLAVEGATTAAVFEAMYRSSARLAVYICNRHKIRVRCRQIVLHRQISTTGCPSPHFDFGRYLKLVRYFKHRLYNPQRPTLWGPVAAS